MKTNTHSDRSRDFYFADIDTMVLVEETESELIVRATRNTFTEQRKIRWIRELAAEGFISSTYGKFAGFDTPSWIPVRWRIDRSWVKPNPEHLAQSRRFMVKLFAGAVAAWLGLMALLFLR